MKLSIVATLYKSAPYIAEFHRRASAAARQLAGDDYEIVLVNDGSPDNSLEMAIALHEADPHTVVVDLSRNFGHHAAIVAGLETAKGERIFLIDCDLEEQPEWLAAFAEEMGRTGADVVFGTQEKRIHSKVTNFCGTLFWRALNFMSEVKIPHNPMTCRLMTREYVEALLKINDKVLFLGGIFAWAGFKQHALPLVKCASRIDKSTYTLSKKLLLVINSFSSFSAAPLYMIFISGVCICAASLLYAAYLAIYKLLHPGEILSGFTSIMFSIWFLSGIIVMSLGVIGLYLAKIFKESKNRPIFIIKKIYK